MSQPYRDHEEAVRQRIDELRREVELRKSKMRPELRTWLPADLLQRIQSLEALAEGDPEGLEQLAALQSTLERLRDALDEAIGMAPDLEAGGVALPQAVRIPTAVGFFSFGPDQATPSAAQTAHLFKTVSGLVEGPWRREGRFGFRTEFHRDDAPFAMVSEFIRTSKSTSEVSTTIATSVARGAPKLRVSPENLSDTWFRKPLGLVRDVVVGDMAFDGIFLVDANPASARILLPPQIRQELLELAREGVPTLEVGDGVAEIRWVFELREKSFERAIRVLLHMRNAPVHLNLLRDS